MIPLTYSWLFPVIILPVKSLNWSYEKLKLILFHELVHIKNHDCLQRFLTGIVCSLFWFIPFLWIANKKMQVEQEKTSDEFVLKLGLKPTYYAEELVKLTKYYSRDILFTSTVIPIVKTSLLEVRVISILKIQSFSNIQILLRTVFAIVILITVFMFSLIYVNPMVTLTASDIVDHLKTPLVMSGPTDIKSLDPELINGIVQLPVLWPIADGQSNVNRGKFIVSLKSVKIFLIDDKESYIVAIADGEIEFVKKNDNGTFKICIKHDNGIYSYYSNVSYMKHFLPGDNIKQGDFIAFIKNTNYVNYSESIDDNYLDFFISVNGSYVNPLDYILAFKYPLYISLKDVHF